MQTEHDVAEQHFGKLDLWKDQENSPQDKPGEKRTFNTNTQEGSQLFPNIGPIPVLGFKAHQQATPINHDRLHHPGIFPSHFSGPACMKESNLLEYSSVGFSSHTSK